MSLARGELQTVAVIVHWGPTAPSVQLAHQLESMSAIADIVVVANDSKPKPPELSNSISWLIPNHNLGFAGGFRFACDARPDADVYVLLNNDVSLPETTVDRCLDLVCEDRVGVVGPTLFYARGVQPRPDRLTPLFSMRLRRHFVKEPTDVTFIAGAIMFIRAECHRQISMDPRFFLLYEETDFLLRVSATGWRVIVAPDRAWHRVGGTMPHDVCAYYSTRNRIWFSRIHGRSWQQVAVVLWLALAFIPRAMAADAVRGRGTTRWASFSLGLWDGVRTLPAADTFLPGEPRFERWKSPTIRHDQNRRQYP